MSPRGRRALAAGLALVAAGWLVAMVITGALPRQRARVEFEAKGVLAIPPERVQRVEIIAAGRRGAFERDGAKAWSREGGGALDPAIAARLSMAVQFMHTAGPVRTMSAEETRGADPSAFGFETLALAAALYVDGQRVLTFQFGRTNPEGFAQYMRLDGKPELFLMSRFVGEEWAAVAKDAIAP
ncbi:MAG: DUF4340 domain-containing protein [Burkholderiales bacterium]|nr:DUF4340 domain-containing protein [Burkholderiales bacterium]